MNRLRQVSWRVFEETLTLHTLGRSPELCRSLGTTNSIESVMSQMGQYTDKVDRWQNSNQILRWTAAALLGAEPRLRKIRGFRYLAVLRFKLREIVRKRLRKKQSVSIKNRGVWRPSGFENVEPGANEGLFF